MASSATAPRARAGSEAASADREQARLELSLREVYARATLFYYGASAAPSRPVTPLAAKPRRPSFAAEEKAPPRRPSVVSPSAAAASTAPARPAAPAPAALRSWEVAERAAAPPEPAAPPALRKRKRRAAPGGDDVVIHLVPRADASSDGSEGCGLADRVARPLAAGRRKGSSDY